MRSSGLVVNCAGYSGHVQISNNADRLGEYRVKDADRRWENVTFKTVQDLESTVCGTNLAQAARPTSDSSTCK